jgi:hypothetical protein
MCRRRAGLALFAATVTLLPLPTAAVVPPQDVQSPEEVLRRIEALRPELEEARAAADEARRRQRLQEARAAHPPMDTLAVGQLRIVTPPDQSELARELFSEVWSERFANVTGSPSLAGRYFTFQWRLQPDEIYMTPPTDGGAPVTRVELYRLTDRSRAAVKRRIHVALSDALAQDFARGSPLGGWLWGYHPGDLEPTTAFRQLSLAASLGGAFGACLGGDAGACWVAQSLVASEDPREGRDALTASFSEEDKVALVRRVYDRVITLGGRGVDRLGARNIAELDACLVQEVTGACDQFVPGRLVWYFDSAGGGTAIRWTLFWHAVEVGGEGAWERALERLDTDPTDVLTHASGLDAEALAESWLDETLQARPTLSADLGVTRWAVFLWVLIFLALALRSTRWRLN